MKLVKNQIEDYYSINITEDEPEWTAPPTVYNNGQEARQGHFIYKYAGVSGTNTDTQPTDNLDTWVFDRASNYYAMIGGQTSQQTQRADLIDFTIDLNRYDTLAFLNIEADEIIVTVTDNDSGDTLFDETYDLSFRNVINYTTYFFDSFEFQTRLYIDIPFYSNARARVQVNKPNATAKVGRLVAGRKQDLGATLFGVEANLDSYATQTLNEFGSQVEQSTDPTYNEDFLVQIDSARYQYLKDLRKQLDFIAVLFVGDESDSSKFQNLISYGYWQSAGIPINSPTKSVMQLTINEIL